MCCGLRQAVVVAGSRPLLPPATAAAQPGHLLLSSSVSPSVICPSLVGQVDTVAVVQTGRDKNVFCLSHRFAGGRFL